MKSLVRLSFLLVTVLFCQASNAQGNLQFNRAVLEQWSESIPTHSTGYYFITPDHPFTVPVGKVWKIESINLSPSHTNAYLASAASPSSLINGSAASAAVLYLNETIIYSNADLASSGEYLAKQIVWLPAGNYVFKMGVRRSSVNVINFTALVTAIEFNVVP